MTNIVHYVTLSVNGTNYEGHQTPTPEVERYWQSLAGALNPILKSCQRYRDEFQFTAPLANGREETFSSKWPRPSLPGELWKVNALKTARPANLHHVLQGVVASAARSKDQVRHHAIILASDLAFVWYPRNPWEYKIAQDVRDHNINVTLLMGTGTFGRTPKERGIALASAFKAAEHVGGHIEYYHPREHDRLGALLQRATAQGIERFTPRAG